MDSTDSARRRTMLTKEVPPPGYHAQRVSAKALDLFAQQSALFSGICTIMYIIRPLLLPLVFEEGGDSRPFVLSLTSRGSHDPPSSVLTLLSQPGKTSPISGT